MRIFDFDSYSSRFICNGIFLSGTLLALRMMYLDSYAIDKQSSFFQVFLSRFLPLYWGYIEPIVLVVFIWLLVAALYRVLEK